MSLLQFLVVLYISDQQTNWFNNQFWNCRKIFLRFRLLFSPTLFSPHSSSFSPHLSLSLFHSDYFLSLSFSLSLFLSLSLYIYISNYSLSSSLSLPHFVNLLFLYFIQAIIIIIIIDVFSLLIILNYILFLFSFFHRFIFHFFYFNGGFLSST